jgi:hypothetical protein
VSRRSASSFCAAGTSAARPNTTTLRYCMDD